MKLRSNDKTTEALSLSKKNGFSLIELVVSVAIVGLLSAFSLGSYQKYLRQAYKTASKVELSDIRKTLEYMHSVDGGYHTMIYSAGYRLPKKIRAFGGFSQGKLSEPISVCSIFPRNTDLPSKHSQFFTLAKDSFGETAVNGAKNSVQVCKRLQASGDQCESKRKEVLGPAHRLSGINWGMFSRAVTGSRPLLPSDSKGYTVHDCNRYTYGVLTTTPKKLYLLVTNAEGELCAGEEDETWVKQN